MELNKSGVGVVLVDHMGHCVASCSKLVKGGLDLEVAEAMALRRVVILAQEEGFSNISFNTDCLSVVQHTLLGKSLAVTLVFCLVVARDTALLLRRYS